MNAIDLDRLLATKDKPCLSIILPTKRYTRERTQNPELIDKAISKARILLTHCSWPKTEVAEIIAKLNSIINNIDMMRLQDGLAIFISPDILKIYFLPFVVTEKVVLGRTFEVRDLVYFNQLLQPYYLLALSRKRARLFKGSGRDLQEIINSDFPKKNVDDYEYERPSIGSSSSSGLKSFERDKSIVIDTRVKAFFRSADDKLSKYVKGETMLFVAGVKEEIADFENLSHYSKHIVGKIPGNYDVDAVHPLAETAWKKIKEQVASMNEALLAKLDENIGRHLAVDGLCNVWRAAKEGKGLTLLLEKDYQDTAYLKPGDDQQIFQGPPAGDYEIVQDAADDIIEIVKEKGGDVVILENGQLDNYQHIALLLRYEG